MKHSFTSGLLNSVVIKSTLLTTSILGAMLILPSAAFAQNSVALNAAVLPNSRTTTVGTAVTVFGTISNSGPDTATNCSVGLLPDDNSGGPNPSGLSVSYRAYEADNITPKAATDTPVDIPNGTAQAYVISISGSNPFENGEDIYFDFTCLEGSAPSFESVNTLLLVNASSAISDIITIGTSPTADGIITIPTLGAGEIMSVAALNIGVGTSSPPTPAQNPVKGSGKPQAGGNGASVVVVPDFGAYELALDTYICETDPATALCLAPYGREVRTVVGDAPSTFNVFVNSNKGAGIPLYADIARQFIRFYEDTSSSPVAANSPAASSSKPAALPPANSGAQIGATGHAVTSPGPAIGDFENVPDGIWNIVWDTSNGTAQTGRYAGVLGVTVEGEWNALISETQAGSVYQFGFLNADKTITPDPDMSLEFTNFEEDPEDDSSQIVRSYQGSGNWRPFTFMSGTASNVVSATSAKTASGPAINNADNGSFRALYDEDYDRTVTFASLAGNYDILERRDDISPVGDDGDVTIASDGSFSGTITPEPGENCIFSGFLTEYGNGKNLFAVNFDVTNCSFTTSFAGHGFLSDNEDELLLGGVVPDVFTMILRNSEDTMAIRMNWVPQGFIVLSND